MTTMTDGVLKTIEHQNGVFECKFDGICIQRVDPRMLDGIDQSNYSWCNTSNHRDTEDYEKNQQRFGNSNWYQQIMEETRMEKWQCALGHLTRKPEFALTINAKQQKEYFNTDLCRRIAFQGVRAKRLLGEEARDLAKELQEASERRLIPSTSKGWFVRTSACSTKDAQDDGGVGPHHSLEDVILALFASERIHISMKNYTKYVKVYLFPFDPNVAVERELRVFVHQNRVTAISQYDVFNASSVFSPMDDAQLSKIAHMVDAYHRENVKDKWTRSQGIVSYVMDVEYIPDEGIIRLIELNSFGAEMAASSALFHWIRDASILKPPKLEEAICIRIRAAEEEAS